MKDWNLLMIAVDALRPDYLSCYGYSKAATPNIDSLAENGVIFRNAISVSTLTPVIFSTLFTGTYPFQHGVREFNFALSRRFPTVAEIFAEAGWRTGAILGSVVMDKSRSFHRGFQHYDDTFDVQSLYDDRRIVEDPNNAIIFRFGEVNTNRAETWLHNNAHDPFFLLLHYWDTHVPFFPSRRFLRPDLADYSGVVDGSVKQIEQINAGEIVLDEADVEYMRGLYEAGVQNVDDGVGRLLSVLSDKGVLENTVIVLLADHGCNLGEHDFFGNGRLLYERDLRIPLVVSGPMVAGHGGKEVDGVVSSIDVFPTIMKNWGIDVGDHVRGMDMTPLINGEMDEFRDHTYSESFFPVVNENKRIAFRSRPWKLIREPRRRNRSGMWRHNLDMLKVFIYRYWTNKTQRHLLRKKLWDTLLVREKVKIDSRVERAVMARRGCVRELFNLATDPDELTNLYDSEQAAAARCEKLLADFMAENCDDVSFAERIRDEEVAKRLESLGYV